MDLIGHIYRKLREQGGYRVDGRGVGIHSLYRDEVQDFTQGELLLDMLVVKDPNNLVYAGEM
jgi:hypothetical protein